MVNDPDRDLDGPFLSPNSDTGLPGWETEGLVAQPAVLLSSCLGGRGQGKDGREQGTRGGQEEQGGDRERSRGGGTERLGAEGAGTH